MGTDRREHVEKLMRLTQYIDINTPGPSSSPAMQLIAEDNWSYFGGHERLDIIKKLKEQPRLNPTNPKTFKTGEGGQ
jgi:hypothetical protein